MITPNVQLNETDAEQDGCTDEHLINQGVGVGDLFVFFGWFRRTIEQNGKLTFDPQDEHGRHIVFGWLEVGHVIDSLPLPKGLHSLSDHPHVQFFEDEVHPNRIYVSGGTRVWSTNNTYNGTTQVHSTQIIDPQLVLTIYDAKTKNSLWETIDHRRLARREKNREKETINSAQRLVDELKTRASLPQ